MIPIYEAVFDEEALLSFVSFVSEPAIKNNWLAFSKQQINLLNEEKKIITGPALIPDMKIERLDKNNNPYYLVWTKQSIEKAVLTFFNYNKGINKTTLEHSTDENGNPILSKGMTLYESWIKQGSNDKSNLLFDKEYPDGTWFVSYKITDNKLWDKIKQGDFKGFSIEAYLGLQLKEDSNPIKQTVQTESIYNIFKNFND